MNRTRRLCRNTGRPANFYNHVGLFVVRAEGLEPPHLAAAGPKPAASTNSATPAEVKITDGSRRNPARLNATVPAKARLNPPGPVSVTPAENRDLAYVLNDRLIVNAGRQNRPPDADKRAEAFRGDLQQSAPGRIPRPRPRAPRRPHRPPRMPACLAPPGHQ
jgi:hypothetical protein